MIYQFLIYGLPHFEDEEFNNSLIHTIFVSTCLLNLLVKLLFSVVLMIFKMFLNVMEPLLLVLSVLNTHSLDSTLFRNKLPLCYIPFFSPGPLPILHQFYYFFNIIKVLALIFFSVIIITC